MKRLLVVVDMQNDFVSGSLGTKEAEAIVAAVEEEVRKYQDGYGDVVFTQDTHQKDYLSTPEGKKLPVEHCIEGTWGWEIIDGLKEYAGHCIRKPSFGSIELAEYVTEMKYDAVELIGLCTDICVVSNALLLKAFRPEMEIGTIASCCAGVTPESHEAALTTMRMCQITVK